MCPRGTRGLYCGVKASIPPTLPAGGDNAVTAPLSALEPQRRPTPSSDARAHAAELARLQRENHRLQAKLTQAEVIIDVQKKRATLLGIVLPDPPSDAQD